MALGSTSSFGNSGPLLFLSPRTKDPNGLKVAPHFTVDRKGADGKYTRDTETVTKVTGDLFKVEVKTGEYDGEPTWEAVYYLRDKDANESYRIGIRFGIPGRGLINSLYSLLPSGDFTRLVIDYFENKNGYDTFGLKQGDSRDNVKWAVSLDAQPKAEPIMHKGKLVKNDYTAVNEFWAAKLEEIAAVVNKAPVAQNVTKETASVTNERTDTALDQAEQATKPAAAVTTTKKTNSRTATKTTPAKVEQQVAAASSTPSPDPF